MTPGLRVPSDAGGEPAALGAAGEGEWARLRAHLDYAPGFWLGFLFSPDPAAAGVLERRTQLLLRQRARPMLALRPTTPAELAEEALGSLFGPEAATAGCVWLTAIEGDRPDLPSWTGAWEQFLLRLNERRDALRRALAGGLLLAAVPAVKPLARVAAPDLWSVRAIVLDLGAREAAKWDDRLDRDEAETIPDDAARKWVPLPVSHAMPAEVVRALDKVSRFLEAGSTAAAVETGRRALELAQESGVEPRDLAVVLAWLSRAEEAGGDEQAAMDHARRALDLLEGTGDRLILELLDRVGRLAARHGDVAAELDARERQLDATRRLLEFSGETPGAQRVLSVSLDRVGNARLRAGDLPAATAAHEESLALRRRLLDAFGDTPEALRDLSVSLNRVGDARLRAGDTPAATAAYEESLALDRRLLDAFGDTPEALRDLSVSLDKVGDARLRAGDLPAATAAYEESLALRRRLLDAFGEAPEALRDLSISLGKVAEARKAAGDMDGAAAARAEAAEVLRRLDGVADGSPA
ncbi:MAG: hypothetical protein ACR2MO_06305 [Acidimicrobiales bacterium]